jgi:hypothetical protein
MSLITETKKTISQLQHTIVKNRTRVQEKTTTQQLQVVKGAVKGLALVAEDDFGNINWGNATANAAGNDREVQFNNGGIFGADPSFTFDGTFLNSTNSILGNNSVQNLDNGIYLNGVSPGEVTGDWRTIVVADCIEWQRYNGTNWVTMMKLCEKC